MENANTFPRPRVATLAEAFSRVTQEMALRQAMRSLWIEAKPGPVSYPLGFAMGIFSAHMGYVTGQVLQVGVPPLVVAFLATLLLVAGCLALWRQRDRWILYLAATGAAAGLVLAPWIVDVANLDGLVRLGGAPDVGFVSRWNAG